MALQAARAGHVMAGCHPGQIELGGTAWQHTQVQTGPVCIVQEFCKDSDISTFGDLQQQYTIITPGYFQVVTEESAEEIEAAKRRCEEQKVVLDSIPAIYGAIKESRARGSGPYQPLPTNEEIGDAAEADASKQPATPISQPPLQKAKEETVDMEEEPTANKAAKISAAASPSTAASSSKSG